MHSLLITRRRALVATATTVVGAAFAQSASSSRPRMTVNLMCGAIGVQAGQRAAIQLAAKHRFQSVEPMVGDLAKFSNAELSELLAEMTEKGIVFGAATLAVDFRQDQTRFAEGIQSLAPAAVALQRAGVTRMGTWISPGSNSLTYRQNFHRHKERLGEIASILSDHGVRFGLEYVGTISSRHRFRYGFIHSMAEARELIAEIGSPNMGLVLDSWHWWQAGDKVEDILALTAKDVIAVDLNDAPSGLPKEQQLDNRRELPLATGVIDLAGFVRALHRIDYDGPVRAEPFNKALNDLDNDAACARASEALHKAFALIE